MILRKPYAFLIKNFKLIHLILSALMIFIAFKTNIILTLYKDYINKMANVSNPSNYVTMIMYLAIILILVLCGVIYWLMRYKKKPKLLYILIIMVYLFVIFSYIYSYNNMLLLEKNLYDPKTVRLVRDIIRIAFWLQCLAIIPIVIRTLGFDIKKFAFAKDLQELNINVTDDEEVELLVGLDTSVIKRKGRKKLRELKYYYKENKIFINIIIGIIVLILSSVVAVNVFYVNKKYTERETFSSGTFDFEILNTFITSKKYDNTDVGFNDTSYVIIKFTAFNKSQSNDYEIKTSNFVLLLDKNTYFPTKKYYDYFSDLGIGYKDTKIKANEMKTYILVYSVEDKYLTNNMTIRYELGYDDNGKSNRIIKLSPTNLDETTDMGEYMLEESLNFNSSILNGSSLVFNQAYLKSIVAYKEKECITENDCYDKSTIIKAGNDKTLLVLDSTSNYKESYIDLNTYNLINYYGKLKYVTTMEFTSKIINKTPISSKGKLYLEVDYDASEASKVWFEFNIRGKKYNYILIDN